MAERPENVEYFVGFRFTIVSRLKSLTLLASHYTRELLMYTGFRRTTHGIGQLLVCVMFCG
jgi:hypothetical protein